MLPTAALAAQNPVSYIERGWDGSAVTEQTKTVETYTPLTKPLSSGTAAPPAAGMWPAARSPSISASINAENASIYHAVIGGNGNDGGTITLTVTPDEGYELDTLTVTDNQGSQRKLTSLGGGKYTFTMPSGSVTVSAVFTRILLFVDVDKASWYADAVRYVYDCGLMNGTDTDRFSPDSTASRAMIATVLWRMAGSPVVSDTLPFADVADGTWYTESARWASVVGIVGGYRDDAFGPDDAVTREQLAAMLMRFVELYNP